jgi:hypothetical protein
MQRQTTDRVLMVRPECFGFNADAAATNRLQHDPAAVQAATRAATPAATTALARAEFDALARALAGEGVEVCIAADAVEPPCPDAVFPNNWVSFHADGTLVLYPLQPASRRPERRAEVVAAACATHGFEVRRTLDLTAHEAAGEFLEGTGSLVLDHVARVAYACLSPRTHANVLGEWCERLGYEAVAFRATDAAGVPWYHTNVMLSIGSAYALVAAESIDPADRGRVLDRLAASGRTIIGIDRRAVAAFAGNVLELAAWDEALGDLRVLVMSAQARAALAPLAWARLSGAVDSVLVVPVPTIEHVGGGSVRCMLAEVFLPPAVPR